MSEIQSKVVEIIVLHALGYRVDTGRDQSSGAGGLHQTDAAGTLAALPVMKGTQCRDLIAALPGCLQNSVPLLYFVRDTFDLYFYFSHGFPSLTPQ